MLDNLNLIPRHVGDAVPDEPHRDQAAAARSGDGDRRGVDKVGWPRRSLGMAGSLVAKDAYGQASRQAPRSRSFRMALKCIEAACEQKPSAVIPVSVYSAAKTALPASMKGRS